MIKTLSNYNPRYYNAHKESYKKSLDRYRRTENGYKKILLNGVKNRAKRKGIEFSLTVEQVTWPSTCPIFGFPLIYTPNEFLQRWKAPTIARIDDAAGYIEGNVKVVSYLASPLASALADSSLKLEMAPPETIAFTEWATRQLHGRCAAPDKR